MAEYKIETNTWEPSELMVKLRFEKKAANEHQKRRHEDWLDNYDLYRNKVKQNRLTQRQAVNIPLMKETLKTILSKIDESPNVVWQELSGDEEKELIFQEVWNDNFKTHNYELADILDKKNVLLYGIGTKKLNIVDDGVTVDAIDPYDVIYDPLMKVGDVESARFIVHQNIFKSASEIDADERYSKKGKEALRIWVTSTPGITQSAENRKQYEEKMKRMRDMGLNDYQRQLAAAGDRLINLTEHYTNVWDEKKGAYVRKVVVYAEDTIELLCETLEDLIGVDFWPFIVWNEDPESQDIYADSVADLVRTPNKIANVWWSQYIENRSLANFGMHWYLPSQGYQAQTYVPGQGVMLPAPPGENINNVIKPVEITGLEGTLDAINWLTTIVERSTGATAIEKGEPEAGQQTLGEVQILVGKAMERTVSIAKFYRLSWYELAVKWNRLMQANAPKFMTLYKASASGKVYPKRVYAGDWKSKSGYEPQVKSTSEQEANEVKTLQKFAYVKSLSPNNLPLQKITLARALETLDLSPEELKEVEDGEDQQQMQAQTVGMQPDNEGQMQDVQSKLQELSTMNAQ